MSKESRQEHTRKLSVMRSALGHDSSVAHAFNHTGGSCPKCGCPNQVRIFCAPDARPSVGLSGCELDGEHLHLGCSACKYCWIERCLDQAILSEEQGEFPAESESAAALAYLVSHHGGITMQLATTLEHRGWIIKFHRDPEAGTITITSGPAPPQKGEPATMPRAAFEETAG